jgi:DNA-binding HxlR family transcriptional regulator
MILYKLNHHKVLRYGELKKMMPKMSDKVLTQQLKELEDIKLVKRNIYQVIPPKVEYSLTELGEKISPVLQSLGEFGMNFTN